MSYIALIVSVVALIVAIVGMIKTEAMTEIVEEQPFEYVVENLERAAASLEEKEREVEPTAFLITEEEEELIVGTVYAEAGDQGYYGMVLVCQCIRNGCEMFGLRPAEALEGFQYAEPKEGAGESVREAVRAVFEDNFKVTELPILYFYSTRGGFKSEWHETQDYVLTHRDHKFFARKEN